MQLGSCNAAGMPAWLPRNRGCSQRWLPLANVPPLGRPAAAGFERDPGGAGHPFPRHLLMVRSRQLQQSFGMRILLRLCSPGCTALCSAAVAQHHSLHLTCRCIFMARATHRLVAGQSGVQSECNLPSSRALLDPAHVCFRPQAAGQSGAQPGCDAGGGVPGGAAGGACHWRAGGIEGCSSRAGLSLLLVLHVWCCWSCCWPLRLLPLPHALAPSLPPLLSQPLPHALAPSLPPRLLPLTPPLHASAALQVVLGDRELTITLARVWHSLSFWEKIKLTSTLLWTGIRWAGWRACGLLPGPSVAGLVCSDGGSMPDASMARVAVLCSLLTCTAVHCVCRSMLDGEEMRQEMERLKETDAITEAIREFGKVRGPLAAPSRTCMLCRLLGSWAAAGLMPPLLAGWCARRALIHFTAGRACQ